jgi:hypothetical protein
MEKRFLNLLVLLLGIAFMLNFVSEVNAATEITNPPLSGTIGNIDDWQKGMSFAPKGNIFIYNVTKSSSSPATAVQLWTGGSAAHGTDSAGDLGTATYFGNVATFDTPILLTSGAIYSVTNSQNTSNWRSHSELLTLPAIRTNLNWTGNCWGNCASPGSNSSTDAVEIEAIYIGNISDSDQFPAITINSPANNSNIVGSSVTFDYSITDDYNITNMSLWIDGIRNFSQIIGAPSFATNTTVSGFSNGAHIWLVQAYDNVSQQTNSSTINFVISNSTIVFENVNVTNDLNVGQNIFSINGFFTFLGSSVSRITSGWFVNIRFN